MNLPKGYKELIWFSGRYSSSKLGQLDNPVKSYNLFLLISNTSKFGWPVNNTHLSILLILRFNFFKFTHFISSSSEI